MLNLFVMAGTARHWMKNLLGDRKGAAAMEYGIIAAVTVVIVGTAMAALGTNLTSLWQGIANAVNNSTAGGTVN